MSPISLYPTAAAFTISKYPVSMSSVDTAGLGVGLIVDNAISNEILMEVLAMKVSSPQEFLPVTDVVVRCSDDGLGKL
jgi:hypothetical protein